MPRALGYPVFVTSVSGAGDLSAWADAGGRSGIAAGDAICRARAAAAALPEPDAFVAWLSDATTDARDRVTAPGPFVRADGFLWALSKSAIISLAPGLRSGLNVTELGTYYVEPSSQEYVWTGTEWSGQVTPYHCEGWSSSLLSSLGTAGSSATTRYTWSAAGSAYCNLSRPIYCFSNSLALFADDFERAGSSRWSAIWPP